MCLDERGSAYSALFRLVSPEAVGDGAGQIVRSGVAVKNLPKVRRNVGILGFSDATDARAARVFRPTLDLRSYAALTGPCGSQSHTSTGPGHRWWRKLPIGRA